MNINIALCFMGTYDLKIKANHTEIWAYNGNYWAKLNRLACIEYEM